MSGSHDNKLSIRTKELHIDLDGKPGHIRRAYRSMRTLLIEEFYQTMVDNRGPQDKTLELPGVRRKLEQVDDLEQDDSGEENFINMVICEDIYYKMYLLDEERFDDSFLSQVLRGDQVRRIYVNAQAESDVRDRVDVGNTLWRELTAAGKAVVGRSD